MSAPALPDVIDARVRALLRGMYVMLPARVTAYDHTTQKCSAQPLSMNRRRNVDGDIEAESKASIGDIPVQFPGSGDNSITWKLKVGDIVMLVFASSSMTRWLLHGGEVDQADGRRQNINDAVAVPGLRCFNPNAPGGAAPIDEDGVTEDDAMVLAAPEIRLGASDADDPVLRRSDMTALRAALTSAVIGIGAGGAATVVAAMDAGHATGYWPPGSAAVKAK
jgi:hypothetical protein